MFNQNKWSNFNVSRRKTGCPSWRVYVKFFLYMMYVDEPISIHERSNASAKILTVNCGAPNFADDISFIALTPYNLKSLIDIVYRYSEKWKFSISVEKSCIMVYSNVQTRIELLLGIVYGDKYIEAATNTVHLGIRQLCYDRSRSSPARAQSNYINRTVQKDDYPICTLRMRVMEQYVENRYKHFQPIATFYCKTKGLAYAQYQIILCVSQCWDFITYQLWLKDEN